jgi:cytochrome c oxidase assembly factor CtaG
VSWWCSATGKNWSWAWQPYIGAWMLAGVLAVLLVVGFRRDRGFPLRRKVCAFVGVLVLLAATDWPLASLGAGYLISVQMARQVLMVFVAVPLLLYGMPPVVGRWLQRGRQSQVYAVLTRPVIAVVLANTILILCMSPLLADPLIPSPLGSFLLDAAWLIAGVILWLPVQPPSPLRPRLVGPPTTVYLIIQSIVPLPVAFFMTWAEYPLYSVYELAPRLIDWLGPVDDQQVGAGMLQVVGGLVIWTQIAVRFLNWAVERQRAENQIGDPEGPSGGEVVTARTAAATS